MRRSLVVTLVAVGIGLMVIGLMSAAPWGASTVADSDPLFAGAPLLFVLGIVSFVSSALVYELLPDKRRQ
jgi:hypothetical protein